MATCPLCQHPMHGSSCCETRAFAWGAEPGWDDMREAPDDPTWPCRDCGTPPRGNHHRGCCVALCRLGCRNPYDPSYPDQAMFCRHAPDEDDGEPDEIPIPPPRLGTPAPLPMAHV